MLFPRAPAGPPGAGVLRPWLAALARVAGLSPGRFMHAFTADVGIPLRPYRRWLKLERAAAALGQGRALGEAAYAAGFAGAKSPEEHRLTVLRIEVTTASVARPPRTLPGRRPTPEELRDRLGEDLRRRPVALPLEQPCPRAGPPTGRRGG